MARTDSTRKGVAGGESARAAILNAALNIFSREGAAGARTEEIARAAGVNKALLYYYFENKDALLGAVLEHVMGQVVPGLITAIDAAGTPREQVLAYIHMHFDAIASKPRISRLIQYEILRAAEGNPSHMLLIAERFNRPLSRRLQRTVQEGIDCGDFVPSDAKQVVLSILSLVVFYFMTAPVIQLVAGYDPYNAARLAQRKAAVIDFVTHALFVARSANKSPATTAERVTRTAAKAMGRPKKKGRPGERKK